MRLSVALSSQYDTIYDIVWQEIFNSSLLAYLLTYVHLSHSAPWTHHLFSYVVFIFISVSTVSICFFIICPTLKLKHYLCCCHCNCYCCCSCYWCCYDCYFKFLFK